LKEKFSEGSTLSFAELSNEHLREVKLEINSQESTFFTALEDLEAISERIKIANQDQYLAIYSKEKFIGILFARGLDEGYDDIRLAIYLLKNFRGKGFGSKSISLFIERQRMNGSQSKISIKVDQLNHAALATYRKIGFKFCNPYVDQSNFFLMHES